MHRFQLGTRLFSFLTFCGEALAAAPIRAFTMLGLDARMHWKEESGGKNWGHGLLKPLSRNPELAMPARSSMIRYFDSAHYAAQVGVERVDENLFEHYLMKGAVAGLSPNPDFFFREYVRLNPDVPTDPLAAFEHYTKFGLAERRYASMERLRRDASLVARSGCLLNNTGTPRSQDDLDRYGNEIGYYLTRGWKAGQRLNTDFDQSFYLTYYPDAQASFLPPLVHYLRRKRHGRSRYQNAREAQRDVKLFIANGLLDLEYYGRIYADVIPGNCDPGLHFATAGQVLSLRGSPDFSIRSYLATYPDLRNLERPATHYSTKGRDERRIGDVNIADCVKDGELEFSPDKRNLLLVLHEASRTGAPILGYNLARHLARHFNITIWLKKPGSIENDLARFASTIVTWKEHQTEAAAIANAVEAFRINAAILNSAVCHSLSATLYQMKIPIISLIHEFADYVLPRGVLSKMIMYSERVICPAKVIADSVSEECVSHLGWAPSHIQIKPQGYCSVPPVTEKGENLIQGKHPQSVTTALKEHFSRTVVLGAGWIHMRKGVELFIQIAQIYKRLFDKNVLFIWVGAGYNPQGDLQYSVWLKSHVERAGLTDNVLFVEEQPSLDPFYEIADAFLMCSRLDPFPNVAIDANMNGLPVVAFEKTTGYAELLADHPCYGRAVPFLDVSEAASALSELVAQHRRDTGLRDAIRKRATNEFQFSTYSNFVALEVEKAMERVTIRIDQAEKLNASGAIDSDFLRSGLISSHLRQLSGTSDSYMLLDLAEKGIFPANPWPGMSLANLCRTSNSDGVYNLLADGRLKSTHPVHYLKSELLEQEVRKGNPTSIAAHVHAYVTEGLLDIVNPLLESSLPITIYITTDTEAKLEIMRARLAGRTDRVRFIVTPNLGRDIGPFLLGLPDEFWAHEVIGHFHVKASHHLDQDMTRQWKDFIKNHLYSGETVLRQIMLLFSHDSSLGLLFAEDPCQIGWTKNGISAAQLAHRLGIEIDLDCAPIFPIGNMFWARSRALLPLRKLRLTWSDMPDEPLPSDGSMLHALERLTPSICERAELHWATVRYPYAERYTSD